MQPIDERLVQKIHELVADSVNSVAEMERHLRSHVKHKLFQGRAGPDTTNRRFHPTHSDIRNHMYMAAVQHANPKSIKNIYNLRLMIVAKRVPWWQHCLQATIRWRRRKLKGIKRRLQSCCSCCWCWWWGHCLHQQTTKPWWALQQLALRTPNEMAKKTATEAWRRNLYDGCHIQDISLCPSIVLPLCQDECWLHCGGLIRSATWR